MLLAVYREKVEFMTDCVSDCLLHEKGSKVKATARL